MRYLHARSRSHTAMPFHMLVRCMQAARNHPHFLKCLSGRVQCDCLEPESAHYRAHRLVTTGEEAGGYVSTIAFGIHWNFPTRGRHTLFELDGLKKGWIEHGVKCLIGSDLEPKLLVDRQHKGDIRHDGQQAVRPIPQLKRQLLFGQPRDIEPGIPRHVGL